MLVCIQVGHTRSHGHMHKGALAHICVNEQRGGDAQGGHACTKALWEECMWGGRDLSPQLGPAMATDRYWAPDQGLGPPDLGDNKQ